MYNISIISTNIELIYIYIFHFMIFPLNLQLQTIFSPQRCAPQHPVSVEHSRSTPTIALRVLKPIAEGSRMATFLAPTFSAMCLELGNKVSLGELPHFLRKCCHSWLNFSGELWSNLSTVECLLFYKFMDITYRTYLHHGGVRERLTMKEKSWW